VLSKKSRFLNSTHLNNLSTPHVTNKEESINNSSRSSNSTVSTKPARKTFLNSGYGYGIDKINSEGDKFNNFEIEYSKEVPSQQVSNEQIDIGKVDPYID
jgi:molecular chaperone GrpE (heat shock protein)